MGTEDPSDKDPRARPPKDPFYIRARAIWGGRGNLPTRRGVIRDEATYEQDLSKAAAAPEPPKRPRRRNI